MRLAALLITLAASTPALADPAIEVDVGLTSQVSGAPSYDPGGVFTARVAQPLNPHVSLLLAAEWSPAGIDEEKYEGDRSGLSSSSMTRLRAHAGARVQTVEYDGVFFAELAAGVERRSIRFTDFSIISGSETVTTTELHRDHAPVVLPAIGFAIGLDDRFSLGLRLAVPTAFYVDSTVLFSAGDRTTTSVELRLFAQARL